MTSSPLACYYKFGIQLLGGQLSHLLWLLWQIRPCIISSHLILQKVVFAELQVILALRNHTNHNLEEPIAVAAGEGAKAALGAHRYPQRL